MAALAGRAAGLAIKYGARWLARTAARRGVVSAARKRALEDLSRARAAGVSRRFWDKAARRIGLGAVGTTAVGGGYAAYESVAGKRPAEGGDYPDSKRVKRMSNNQSHGILRSRAVIGRKEPYISKMKKIQKAAERAVVYAFRGINPMSAASGSNKGYFDLWQGGYVGDGIPEGVTRFPVDVYNLTAIDQGGTVNPDLGIQPVAPPPAFNFNVNVPWTLASDASGNMSWVYGRGGQTNSGAVTRYWSIEKQTNSENPAFVVQPGQHCYMDWVRAKLMIYGKKRDETRVHVRLVQFTRDEFCPEYGYVETFNNISTDARQRFDTVAQQFVKGLINNPVATKSNTTRLPFFNVLYSKTVVIPPKMTDDENDDPTKVQLDIFKRMNKLISYKDPGRSVGVPQETLSELNVEQFIKSSEISLRSQPSTLRSNVYLMITAWDPRPTGVPTTDFQNSYDLNLRKRHTLELV